MATGNEQLPPHVCVALEKLKRAERYNTLNEEQLLKRAHDLTDPEYMRCMFSYLFETAGRIAWEVAGQNDEDLLHSLEIEAAHRRAKHGVAQLCHLPVRLLLSKLRRWSIPDVFKRLSVLLSLEYGALHAALQVGEILIEWGRESIVDPQFEPIVPGREFQARIQDQSEWHTRARKFTRDMSMADRRHNAEEKIEVLYQSAAEKHQLLENLIAVIIEYNSQKEYSMFKCNCQHFVHDALVALGIKETPQFSGQLSKYLEHLKRGSTLVAKDLDTHEKLDQYVTDHLDALSSHDMEYLLCQYFKLHLPEMEKDVDNWACSVATCQADKLEDRIKESKLVFNQFRKPEEKQGERGQNGVHVAAAENGVNGREADLSDIDEEEYELLEEFGGISLQKQRSLLNKFSGYRDNVTTKLRIHPFYDQTFEELQLDALSERETFREQYLSNLIEGTSEQLVLQTSFDSEVFSCLPQDEAKQRERDRFKTLYNFPVKLLLRTRANDVKSLKSKPIEQVAIKAALIVGDFVHEWDESSLVFPKKASQVLSSQPTFQVGLLENSEWYSFVSTHKPQIDEAIERLEYDTLVSYQFLLTEQKDKLMYALINEAVDYNRHYEYHKKNCSDKTFVLDAMKALGIKKPFSICSTLKRQTKDLTQSKRKRAVSHLELDLQLLEIDRNSGLKNLPRQDLDFFVAQYFLYHVREWEELECPDPWACSVATCQLEFLHKQCVEVVLNS